MSTGSNEDISVYLENLRSAGFSFQQASQYIANQLGQLNAGTSRTVEEMSSTLRYAPWVLEELRGCWNKALGSLSASLGSMGEMLYAAADSYENTDQQAGPNSY